MLELLEKGALELGIRLTSDQLDKFSLYKELLLETNRKFNLTAITGETEIQLNHFLDSLSPLKAFPVLNNIKVFDLGSGAGFPGLPLKITFPNINLTLLESNSKKAEFLNETCNKLNLTNVLVLNARAEEAGHDVVFRGSYDVVLARAVSRLSILSELALPFCRADGLFIALKKGDITTELKEAEQAITLLGGSLKGVIALNIGNLGSGRKLVVLEKSGTTPSRFPRRSGIPAKRPL